jgi:hypothetical protein
MTDGGTKPPKIAHTAARTTDQATITVEPIPVASHPGTTPTNHEIEMAPDESARDVAAKGPASPVAQPNHRVPRDTSYRAPHRDTKPPVAPVAPLAPFTYDQLAQRFKQVSREYELYKAKFGSRLESEWAVLATLLTYKRTSADDAGRRAAARQLDAFRERMRE